MAGSVRHGQGFVPIRTACTGLVVCLAFAILAGCGRQSFGLKKLAPKSIKVEVGIRQNNTVARPIPFLPVCVAPEEDVIRVLSYVHAEDARELAALQASLDRNAADVSEAQAALAKARAEVSRSFNEKVSDGELPSSDDRDPLAKMMAAGAAKSAADREFKSEYGDRVKPLEDRIVSLEAKGKALDGQVALLRESLPSRLFDALHKSESTSFTTNKDGEVVISVPPSGRVAVWAEAARTVTPWLVENYRWYVVIPGPHERDGRVVLGNANLLSAESFGRDPY